MKERLLNILATSMLIGPAIGLGLYVTLDYHLHEGYIILSMAGVLLYHALILKAGKQLDKERSFKFKVYRTTTRNDMSIDPKVGGAIFDEKLNIWYIEISKLSQLMEIFEHDEIILEDNYYGLETEGIEFCIHIYDDYLH